ncbi:MAG: LCCL domain-containing protein [Synechococcales bacterium]|nr:LCCL domain-containing protein [Synechococcales bacterium]
MDLSVENKRVDKISVMIKAILAMVLTWLAGLGAVEAIAPPATIQTINWATTAASQPSDSSKDLTYYCPANGSAAPVWGSDVYSDRSSICTAAVHAGLITFENGGAIAIRRLPGQSTYASTTQNEVTTAAQGEAAGSFTFINLRDTVAIALDTPDGRLPVYPITWEATAQGRRKQMGQPSAYYCPAGGTLHPVWGSGAYAEDSSICSAAVHGGAIAQDTGGTVVVTLQPGQGNYRGSTQHGVTSGDRPGGTASFTVTAPIGS